MLPAQIWRLVSVAMMAVGLQLPLSAGAMAHDAAPAGQSKTPDVTARPAMPMAGTRAMRMPEMNAARGRTLFVTKGCVACHSINVVGGHDATPLDAHTMAPAMNPFDFAAKMWRMAPAMIYAQEDALGGQIEFTGDELADIIAFVHDDQMQHDLAESDITPDIRKMMNHSHGEPAAGATQKSEPDAGHGHSPGGAPQTETDH